MDRVSKVQRSKNMQAIRSKDSMIEIKLRKALWRRGYRYRKNYRGLPGTPDIVFLRKKVAIFCDSEFWHGYDWKNKKKEIKSNKEFWINKIEGNIKHDKKVTKELQKMGWKVIRLWGKDIQENIDSCLGIIESSLRGEEK